MLYVWKEGEDVKQKYPEIDTIPEFAKISDRHFKVVALVADIKSPLRTLPEKERRERACIAVGWPMEGSRLNKNARTLIEGKMPTVEAAIEVYKKNQFDEDRDLIYTNKRLIQTNNDYIRAVTLEKNKNDNEYGKKLERANKLAKELPELRESLKRLEEVVNQRDEKPELPITYTESDISRDEEGDQPMSTLDKVMMQEKK